MPERMSDREDRKRFLTYFTGQTRDLHAWSNIAQVQKQLFGHWHFPTYHEPRDIRDLAEHGEHTQFIATQQEERIARGYPKSSPKEDEREPTIASHNNLSRPRRMQISDTSSSGQGISRSGGAHVVTTAELMSNTWTELTRASLDPKHNRKFNTPHPLSFKNVRGSSSEPCGYDDTDNSTNQTMSPGNFVSPQGSSSATSSGERDAEASILNVGSEDQNADKKIVKVGMEFEFLVPVEDVQIKHRPDRYFVSMQELASHVARTADYPAQIFIEDTLTEAGTPAVALSRTTSTDRNGLYGVWVVTQEQSIEANSSSEGSFSSSTKGETRLIDEYGLCGLELNSRVLPANADGFRETETVLRALRDHTLMHINENCGLHIHVDANDLSLEEKKHFVSLYLMVEKTLFSLCAPHRQGTIGCLPAAQNSRFAVTAREECDKRRKVFHGGLSLELHNLVHKSADSAQLRDNLLKPGLGVSRSWARSALAMKHVGRTHDEDKWTFEFRQFQVSLDPVLVSQWARICVALVLAARGLGRYGDSMANEIYSTFYDVAISDVAEQQKDDAAWVSLLQILGLDDADTIYFWQQKLLAYQGPNGWTQGEQGDDGFVTVLGS